MKIEFSVDDILTHASNNEREELLKELQNEGAGRDITELVDEATTNEKRMIFDELWAEGFAEDYIKEYSQGNMGQSIESKRFMMDKRDDNMLTYLIEKYKYFT